MDICGHEFFKYFWFARIINKVSLAMTWKSIRINFKSKDLKQVYFYLFGGLGRSNVYFAAFSTALFRIVLGGCRVDFFCGSDASIFVNIGYD